MTNVPQDDPVELPVLSRAGFEMTLKEIILQGYGIHVDDCVVMAILEKTLYEETLEFLWVQIKYISKDRFVGVIYETPTILKTTHFGDTVFGKIELFTHNCIAILDTCKLSDLDQVFE